MSTIRPRLSLLATAKRTVVTVYLYGMSPRQERFVHEYLIDRKGAAAAVRAGYSPHTARQIAYELLTRPDVAEAVRHVEAELAAKAQLAREKVLRGLLSAIDMARAQGDPAAMIAGWREIAKMCGYYPPERKQISLSRESCRLRMQFDAMSDADLTKVVQDLSSAAGFR